MGLPCAPVFSVSRALGIAFAFDPEVFLRATSVSPSLCGDI